MTGPAAWTAREVNAALWWHFFPRWAVLFEVSCYDEEAVAQRSGPAVRRIDALLLRGCADTLAPDRIERLAIEVKVTRGDFLADVRDPAKQAPWRELAHRHAYAVPDGLVRPDEVPAGSGLLYVTRSRSRPSPIVRFERKSTRPPGHVPGPLPGPILRGFLYRASRAEARLRGYHGPDAGADESSLRAKVADLERRLQAADTRAFRAGARADEWKIRYATTTRTPPPCETCGGPLRPSKRRDCQGWEHQRPDDDVACRPKRLAAEADRRRAMLAAEIADPETRPWAVQYARERLDRLDQEPQVPPGPFPDWPAAGFDDDVPL